jgi:hypothetical protein
MAMGGSMGEIKTILKLEDLIGSQVWMKPRGLPEVSGYITAVPKAVYLETIDSSISVSTFRIALASGDVVETSGFNITHIENAEYNRISTRRASQVNGAGTASV